MPIVTYQLSTGHVQKMTFCLNAGLIVFVFEAEENKIASAENLPVEEKSEDQAD